MSNLRQLIKSRLGKEPTPTEVGQKLRKLVTAKRAKTVNNSQLVEDFIYGVREAEGSSQRAKRARAGSETTAV